MITSFTKSAFGGVVLMIYKMTPDWILLPMIESDLKKKEIEAGQSQEELALFVARSKRELSELEPRKEELEAEIETLIKRGLNDAAGELMREFNAIETEYEGKKEEYETGLAEFQVYYDETQIAIEEMQAKLKALKSETARAKGMERLNNIRKAVSDKRFEAGSTADHMDLMRNRNKDRLDQAVGTKMVLDQGTKKSRESLQNTKEVIKAKDEALLARFASKRNLNIQHTEDGSVPNTPTPIMEEKPKTDA